MSTKALAKIEETHARADRTLATVAKESWQLTVTTPFDVTPFAEAEAARVEARREGEGKLAATQQELAATTDKYGAEHPETLRAMVRLALLYEEEEQWRPAMETLEDVIKLRKKTLGATHPETIEAMQQLLGALKRRNHFPATTDIQVVDFRTEWLELDIEQYTYYPFTQDQVLYINWKVWRRIEEPLKEMLADRTQRLGAEHPVTLATMNNLGLCWARQELWSQSAELLSQVLTLRKKVLGPQHPDTMSTTKLLTLVYSNTKEYHKQEELERALIEYFKDRPDDHVHVARSMQNLVLLYIMQWKMKEAEEQDRVLLKWRQEVRGPEHPDTILSWEKLAYTMKLRRLDDEALDAMRICAALSAKVLGEDHGITWWRQRVLRKWTPLELQEDLKLGVPLSQRLVTKYANKPAITAAKLATAKRVKARAQERIEAPKPVTKV